MAWPNAPANDQIFTRDDGVKFRYRSESQSWLNISSGGIILPTVDRYAELGAASVPIPNGARAVRLNACGAGGSGAPVFGVGVSNMPFGGPGGGSGYGGETLIDLTGVSSISVNIGDGGVSTPTTTNNGGDTVVSLVGLGTITFGGGRAGTASPTDMTGSPSVDRTFPGGAGGVLSTTIIGLIIRGGSDCGGRGALPAVGTPVGLPASGEGGSGLYGIGGASRGHINGLSVPAAYTGFDANGYGAGGGGAVNRGGATVSAKGGNGIRGFADFEWIF